MGTSNFLKSKLQDTWAALGNDFLGFIQQTDKIRDLMNEMRGQETGNVMAKKGAKAWLDITEQARTWFNEKGGDIGRLNDWALPQHHSQERVSRAGRDRMDGRGRCLDNVFIERLWRSLKYELVYPGDFADGRQLWSALEKYFVFYNYERPHQALDYRTPASIYRSASAS